MTRAAAGAAALGLLGLAASAALSGSGIGVAAAGGPEAPPGRVVFARDHALWVTDTLGKAKAVELAPLPAGTAATDVRAVRSDADGDTVLVDVGGRWYWGALAGAGDSPAATAVAATTLAELPCAAGPARLSARGECVLCASPEGKARLVRLRDGKIFDRAAPAGAASLVEHDGTRELVWSDGDGGAVMAAPLARARETRVVAPAAPVRGFLAAPDGSRGVGVYRARPLKPAGAPERDELFGFALDGTAARRRLIRDGVVLDWSWDARWLLVQDGDKACIARATGGQFKCWKGFTAVSIAPDGAWALVLGPRSGGGAAATGADRRGGGDEGAGEGGGEGEGEGDDGEGGDDAASDGGAAGPAGAAIPDVAVPLPPGPLSLYRAKLNGPYTERPSLVETVVDGAALWLPVAAPSAGAASDGAAARADATPPASP